MLEKNAAFEAGAAEAMEKEAVINLMRKGLQSTGARAAGAIQSGANRLGKSMSTSRVGGLADRLAARAGKSARGFERAADATKGVMNRKALMATNKAGSKARYNARLLGAQSGMERTAIRGKRSAAQQRLNRIKSGKGRAPAPKPSTLPPGKPTAKPVATAPAAEGVRAQGKKFLSSTGGKLTAGATLGGGAVYMGTRQQQGGYGAQA